MDVENRVVTGFWIHFGTYVALCSGLAAMNLANRPEKLWFPWVVGGWGIGVAAHALSLYAIPGGRERMIEQTADRMEHREERRNRREERHAHHT
jgi:hypothetical protein